VRTPVTWLFGLLLLTSCQSGRLSGAQPKAEIEARTQAYAASLLAGPAVTAAFYTEDGELVSGTNGYRGPKGVREFLEPIWSKADLADPKMVAQSIEIFGDVAYEWGTYSQRAALKGQPLKEYSGRFVTQWRRGPDGRWLVVRMMTNP